MTIKKLFKYTTIAVLATIISFATMSSAQAGKKEDAVAMTEKAYEYFKAHGEEAAFKAFNTSPDFRDGELYVYVLNKEGIVTSHGAKATLIDKNLLKLSDATGKVFGKDLVAVKDTDWVDYYWLNPVAGKVQKKKTYVINAGKYVICVGYYQAE